MKEQLNIFLKEIQHCTYAEKYQRWEDFLQKQIQSDSYSLLLNHFLENFPFNYRYWVEYIQLTKFEQYQTALIRNPKSYELWVDYLSNYKLLHEGEDPLKYKKELEKAIIEIGADSRSLFLYEEFYPMVAENLRYEFYKKVFTRALIGLENQLAKFNEWFEMQNDQQINILAIKELKAVASTLSPEEQRAYLQKLIIDIYERTIRYRDSRWNLEQQIKHNYFDGSSAIREQKQIWRELIQLQRTSGIVENISYTYERSLMAQTDDLQLWEQVFHYMQNQTNKYVKVQQMLRNNKDFFLKFDLGLYFYWCDLEERQNAVKARSMYQDAIKIYPIYQVYGRWIQFQIREKQWANAKGLYDHLLTLYQSDIDMMAYILVEYSEFVVKYYKDFQYAKKLLKTYFDHLPFNQYLFTKYLQFLKNFQNKQGYYDELMLLINEALCKAKKTCTDSDFNAVIRTLKYYLRSTLSSIYLIKLSERKMMEFQQKLTKTHDL